MRELDHKLKTALDESRLLILGAQVLFGFTLEGALQERFSELPPELQAAQGAALLLITLSLCWLVVPSLYHQIACRGESAVRAMTIATKFAGLGLFPFTLGLGASMAVAFGGLLKPRVGFLTGLVFTICALCCLYGLGTAMRKKKPALPAPTRGRTVLKTKIEQLLTEARVIIPGAQALIGFQLVATLTRAFVELPPGVQLVHLAALSAVVLAMILLMTPAALHRIAFHGEDDPRFFEIASRLVTLAAFPLALGIAADIFVVFDKIASSPNIAAVAGVGSLCVLLGFWYGFPLFERKINHG